MATTQGFIPRSGVLPTFTPVDPRLAVADPSALLSGINSGMAFTRGIQADQYARELAPIQQQLAMAQAQQAMQALPQQERLRQFQFDAAQRENTLSKLQPFKVLGNKFVDTDPESGALAEFQEVQTIDPQTGQLVGTTANMTRVLANPGELEAKSRAAESAISNREAQTGYYNQRANKAAAEAEAIAKGKTTTANKPGEVVNYAPLGREVIWNNDPLKLVDVTTKKPLFTLKKERDGSSKLVANPEVWDYKPPETGGAVDPNNPLTWSSVAPTATPNVGFIPPQFSFQSEAAVNQAAAQGLLQDGQEILVNGVRAHWQAGP